MGREGPRVLRGRTDFLFRLKNGPFFGVLKNPSWRDILPSWSQHTRFGTPTWAPKGEENRWFWGVKSQLMLQEPKMSKFAPLSSENLVFAPPRAFKKPSKIDEKSILRAFYVEVFFQHSKKSVSERSGSPVVDFLTQKGKFGTPKRSPKSTG